MNEDPIEEEEEQEQEQEREPIIVSDSSFHKFPYVCTACGNVWEMNFHDIMRLTDQRLMPCGCLWVNLNYVATS